MCITLGRKFYDNAGWGRSAISDLIGVSLLSKKTYTVLCHMAIIGPMAGLESLKPPSMDRLNVFHPQLELLL